MNPPDDATRYQTYLLRCWPTATGQQLHQWRFGLLHVQTGRRRGFGDFEELVAFLRSEMAAGPANLLGADHTAMQIDPTELEEGGEQ
jgi:hypothetical protein